MNWNDAGQLPVHAVAEYAYCPRSAYGLIFDAESAAVGTGSFREGAVMHGIVDSGGSRRHRGSDVRRSMRVSSERLGLVGIIDQVKIAAGGAVEIWEYKRGASRINDIHELQVALLALCYQETLGVMPTIGVVWTTGDRRARRFALTSELIARAVALSGAVRDNLGKPPSAWPRHRQAGCQGCIYRFMCWTEDELADL